MSYQKLNRVGVLYALGAALLFGTSTPFARTLLVQVHPVLLAGTLYFGSASTLGQFLLVSRAWSDERRESGLKRKDLRWLLGATLFGGVLGPVLLLSLTANFPTPLVYRGFDSISYPRCLRELFFRIAIKCGRVREVQVQPLACARKNWTSLGARFVADGNHELEFDVVLQNATNAFGLIL